MNKIRSIQKLNDRELELCTCVPPSTSDIQTSLTHPNDSPPNASWHTDHRSSAWIWLGGLVPELSEGDIVTICSQFGEPVYVNLVRDKETGKSRGFAFLKFEDQRSTDLAVDNLSGAEVLGRKLAVDHAKYTPKEGEDMRDNTGGEALEEEGEAEAASEDGTDREDSGHRRSRHKHGHRHRDRERERERAPRPTHRPARPILPEEIELQHLEVNHDSEDPMKKFLLDEKRQEVADAIAKWEREHAQVEHEDKERKLRHRHHHRVHHSSRRERSASARSDDSERRERRRRRRERDEQRSRSPREERRRRSRERD